MLLLCARHRATEYTEDYGKAELPFYDSADLKRIFDQNNTKTERRFFICERRNYGPS